LAVIVLRDETGAVMNTTERYHPSRDQVALAAGLGDSLASLLPLSRLRESHEESAEIWKALRELGVFEIATPEEQGGSGLGLAEEALIVIELGRRVVAPSILATVEAARLRFTGERSPAPGERRVAAGYRHGDRIVLVDDSGANQLLIRNASGAVLFERPTSSRLIDEKLWSCRLLEATGLGKPLVEADAGQLLHLRLIEAAALAGLAQAALEMAVDYAGIRHQFGRPIGSFQAVKHHCANMALSSRLACDLVSFAAMAVEDHRHDAALQVESAFFIAGSAAIDNARKNIQVHGGIGFSDEADPHRLLKRARLQVEIAGGLEVAITRIGRAPLNVGLEAPHEKAQARQQRVSFT
jgi:alkylation response protein AidB-like acyl-CoA dehydrogenase